MIFDKEFKEALSRLPSKEKDKLILRFLRKDLNLAKRLHFELISEETVEQRREKLENHIRERAIDIKARFYSAGILMMEMRDLSGGITEHVRTTKDKYGEITLSLLMMIEVLKLNQDNINNSSPNNVYTLCVYCVAKAFKIIVLIDAFHEDYRLEFNDSLQELAEEFAKSDYLMKYSIKNGLDLNWLMKGEIPENIKEIHKDIRAQGFLK